MLHEQTKLHLELEPYQIQEERLPKSGKHIIAQYDDKSIIVYQAFRPSIAQFAVEQNHFGGEFSLNRMSWIKTSFLWMMHRSGWGTKKGQEAVLAIRLKRSGFDTILSKTVHSSFQPGFHQSVDEWKSALAKFPVRLQWDPDCSPSGTHLERRAIQLGLQGSILTKYAREWIIDIHDISWFVQDLRTSTFTKHEELMEHMKIPRQEVYPVPNRRVVEMLQLDKAQP